jgi:hypothetical protein
MKLRRSLLLLALMAVISFTANAQDPLDPWKTFDFSNNSIKQAQIQKFEMYQLKMLRGLVFGRHGRVFKDNEIKYFLEEQSWYKPNPDFSNTMLNDTERRNLDLIRIAEAAKHTTIQPGDMRYWRERAIPARKLGKHSAAEWKVLTAEVEAIHGKRFDEEPWLQKYFEERYWYFPSEKYDPKKLSVVERKNLEILSCQATWSFLRTGTCPSRCCAVSACMSCGYCETRFTRATVASFAPTGCRNTSGINLGTRLTKTSRTNSFPRTTS